jgi:hypothetical protein
MDRARGAQKEAGYTIYGAGPSFDGLELTGVQHSRGATTLVYGTCRTDGDHDCAPPLTIETSSICARNPLKLDRRPRRTFAARGTVVRDYGEGRLELAAGASNVVVSGRRARRAVAALRPVSTSALGSTLEPARYPRSYVSELRQVARIREQTGSDEATRAALGITRSAVRFELALAREIAAAGPEPAGCHR